MIGRATPGTHVACVVDLETTGLELDRDGIIRLSARRLLFDDEGVITRIEPPVLWHEEPARPIPIEISKLTGILDGEVRGARIDEDEVIDHFADVDIVIGHPARFAKPFLAKRVPPLGLLLWGCSFSDVDWGKNGVGGPGFGFFGAQSNAFHVRHDASDIEVVVSLLGRQKPDGETILAELVRKAQSPHVLVEAVGAPHGARDVLRRRGYQWNADKHLWEREICEMDCLREELWLSAQVYGPTCGARSIGPFIAGLRVADRFM